MAEYNKNIEHDLNLNILWKILSSEYKTIIFLTIFFIFLSSLVLFFINTAKDVKVSISKPSLYNVKGLSVEKYGINNIINYNEKEIFEVFVNEIQSFDLWEDFVASNKNTTKQDEVALTNYLFNSFSFFHKKGEYKSDIVFRSNQFNDKLVIDYIDFAIVEIRKKIVNNIISSIELQEEKFKLEVENIRNLIHECNSIITLHDYCSKISVDLASSLQRIATLKEIKNSVGAFEGRLINVETYSPESYKKWPNKPLIVVLSVVFGVMLGILIAFLRYFYTSKTQHKKC